MSFKLHDQRVSDGLERSLQEATLPCTQYTCHDGSTRAIVNVPADCRQRGAAVVGLPLHAE